MRAEPVWHFVLLLVCAGAIYVSCEWFVNAVEWLGRRIGVAKMAVGTILAAFGTALPESVVTLVAVTTGSTVQARDIGVGAAMGGPLVLATVAYGVVGFVLLLARRQRRPARELVTAGGGSPPEERDEPEAPGRHRADGPGAGLRGSDVDTARLMRDQRWFLAVFVVKIALGLLVFAVKPWLGLLFFAVYAVYFWREMHRDQSEQGQGEHGQGEQDDEALAPLKLQRRSAQPATGAVVAQTVGALAVIFVSSQLFVHQLEAVGPMIGLSSAFTALLLAPIATELPEVMNAIIWVRQGKIQLALANISGAMMIQATVPSGLGLLFTSWQFGPALTWAGVVTIIAIGYLLLLIRAGKLTPARLAVCGLLYLGFAAGLVPVLT